MSSNFTAIDAATLQSLSAGSEQALEQIFRANFSWILENAKMRLKGEDAAAPKLIVATVREFWDERDGFHTSAEVEAFFNEELRHRARAVRARMAAVHRFEKHEGVQSKEHAAPTVDGIWNEIAAELHKPEVDAATAAKRRREQSSHNVAEHIGTVTERGNWKTPAIIIVVAALITLAGASWFSKRSRNEVISQMLGSAEAQTVDTRAGQLGSVTLSDESTARLGPETRLIIVDGFGGDYRTLSVSGTAAFHVAAGNSQPFEARLGEISVFANGGVFTVRDYADETARMVRADSGDLTVRVAGKEVAVASGTALQVNRDGTTSVPSAELVAQQFSWTGSRLVLSAVPLQQAVQSLFRWYGMDISVRDSTKLETAVTIDVPLESSQSAISAIESAAGLKFEWVDGKMTFQAGGRR